MATDYVVCMTTYPPRVGNLPKVIETLQAQTIPPRKIIVTVARSQYAQMQPVLDKLPVEVRVVKKDVRVFKKFLYAMEEMNQAQLVLTVDDDRLYPAEMAENLLILFNMPHTFMRGISGNMYRHNGLKCHCGGCSLVFPAMFSGWRNFEQYFETWESDDMFYTMLAAQNGYAYIPALVNYEKTMPHYNEGQPYSKPGMVQRTYIQMAKALKWI